MIYWKIGKRIVEKEQKGENRSEYGAYVTKDFSKDLSRQFGKGFSITNIKNFRQFYLAFREMPPASPLHKKLSWTHYRIVMRVGDPDARRYYIREAAKKNWSTRQLARNVKTHYYKSSLSTQELSRKKRHEEKRAARAALTQIYLEIAAMATQKSIPDAASDSHSATTLHSAPGRSDGLPRIGRLKSPTPPN